MSRRFASIASLALALCAWVAMGAGDRAQAESTPAIQVASAAVTPNQKAVSLTTVAKPAAVNAVASSSSSTVAAQPVAHTPRQKQLWMEVTAYCPCTKCCGPEAAGITASGLPVSHNEGKFVAADTKVLPFGSKLNIPGYGDDTSVPVIDRGGAIKGQRLDVFFATHQEALNWGRRWVMVTVED